MIQLTGSFQCYHMNSFEMVKAVRTTAKTLGKDGGSKKISDGSVFYKRSILVSQDIKRGDRLTDGNIRIARLVMAYAQVNGLKR